MSRVHRSCFGVCMGAMIVSLTLLSINNPICHAQAKQANQTPDEQPRKVKREPNNALKDWAKKDVSLIITADEERAFEKLRTDEERENFIAEFWRKRDPDPDTEENEYKDEYYQRIAYANEHFTSGKPGWLTDRGRIYIKWGSLTKSKPIQPAAAMIANPPKAAARRRSIRSSAGSIATFPAFAAALRSSLSIRAAVVNIVSRATRTRRMQCCTCPVLDKRWTK
jgi:GWxTD domain-containing protein